MPEITFRYTAHRVGVDVYIGTIYEADRMSEFSGPKDEVFGRILEHAKIRGQEIVYCQRTGEFINDTPEMKTARADAELLVDIKAGRKKVLPADHWFFRFGLVNAPEPTQVEYNTETDKVFLLVPVAKTNGRP